MNHTRILRWLFTGLLLLAGVVSSSGDLLTFQFTGFIRFQLVGSVPDLAVGDQFEGSYTFDSTDGALVHMPADSTLQLDYNAISAWSVSIPAKGISLSGTSGTISVGNNSPFAQSDRYIVTLWPANPPPAFSGHTLSFFQINLWDIDGNGSIPADLLSDVSIQATPPDLNRISPSGDKNGRFVFGDAQYQNQMTSLTLVPEPQLAATILPLFILMAGRRRRAAAFRRDLPADRRRGDV